MRADPYQARAQALALEAGLDPDAKIDRPGQRPMPTWCTFRDAARKEQVAVEAATVAAALPPQAAQFQNAPLKVFGDHDEGTLAQMRNCMGVGNVVAGVICADGGHQPSYVESLGGLFCGRRTLWRGEITTTVTELPGLPRCNAGLEIRRRVSRVRHVHLR